MQTLAVAEHHDFFASINQATVQVRQQRHGVRSDRKKAKKSHQKVESPVQVFFNLFDGNNAQIYAIAANTLFVKGSTDFWQRTRHIRDD